MEGYADTQFVGIDLHRRRSVIVRMTDAGQVEAKRKLATQSVTYVVVNACLIVGRAKEGRGDFWRDFGCCPGGASGSP